MATAAPKPGSLVGRRHLTVLFCDLVGYSTVANALDPEDLHAMVDAYRRCCSSSFAAHGGTAPRYSGDGILAVFGYPEANEDDPERAVRAALAIVAAVRHLRGPWSAVEGELAVRIGVATGLVVVDTDSSVVGETVNLAARLQSAAEPNTVVVSATTHRLVHGFFTFRDLGRLSLKGYRSPVRAWRVDRPRGVATRFQGAHAHHFTPFIGHRGELARLLVAWQRAVAIGGNVVHLVGEAGIGKSRLIHELRTRISVHPSTTLLFQCVPHHEHTPLFPLLTMLERAAGFTADDDRENKLRKLARLWIGPAEEARAQIPLLAALLSIPTDDRYPAAVGNPVERKRQTSELLCTLVARLARRRPLLMVVEDAQWLDPTSRELLDALAARVSQLPMMIIVSERAPATFHGRTAESIPVVGLDPLESATIVSRLGSGKPLPENVVESILSRSDGVPLFLEELTNAVLESDLRGNEIPDTLQDLLAARLDRLGVIKEVAQLAAVIGREFSTELLHAAMQRETAEFVPALDELVSSGLVVRGVGGYLFKHALIRDAAYHSLLRSRRRELHERIARALERGAPTQVASKPELLAHHFACAGLDERALEFWARAGERALGRSANLEAAQHFSSALAALERLPVDRQPQQLALDCHIGRGAARRAIDGFAAPGVEADFAYARDLHGRGVGTTAQLMDALRGLFACYYTRSDFRKAREQAERVLQCADSPPHRMMGNWMLGCVTFWQGQFVEARRRLETALKLYDPTRQRSETLDAQIDLEANAMLHLAWTLWFVGHPDQAIARADEAIALARGLGQPFALAMALFAACATRVCRGDHAEAEVLATELRAVTDRYRIAYMGSACTVLEGHTAVARGETSAGIERMRQALDEFRRQQAGLGWTFALSLPAAACAQLGRPEEGLELVAEAFEAAERNGDLFLTAELKRLRGDLLYARSPGDLQGPIDCYRQAAALAVEQGARALELRAVVSLARLCPTDTAVWRRLRALYDSFDEGHQTVDLTTARTLLERAEVAADAR